ncbi:hypothetical protein [Pedobacter foliorum]|uniref:TraG/VirB4 family ATPase n=1 Tax=Pedobacter foliorum TaxID=2739058 RepID=UPI00293BC2C3|nr:hypothetical protein [Pedobacter foliorum]
MQWSLWIFQDWGFEIKRLLIVAYFSVVLLFTAIGVCFSRNFVFISCNAVTLYYAHLDQHRDLFPGFNSFYEFPMSEYLQVLEHGKVKERDFDVANSLYVLNPYYKGGDLMGATASDAFSVDCDLGITMNADDLLNEIMMVQVRVAVIHPAEFIMFTFQQQMQPPR